jgi:sialic acid synthase SpsE
LKTVRIDGKGVGIGEPVYIIAEIGSNFDRDINRAKKLVDLAKECGADAVKFQCFLADKIVSKEGFAGFKKGFQAKWAEPVYEVYRHAELPRDWIHELFEYSKKKGIAFLATPYDKAAADLLEKIGVSAFKVGSGDITWLEFLEYVARKQKPILLPTGASTLADVDKAISIIRSAGNNEIILLQCVTNYPSGFESANIRAMRSMGEVFGTLVGYSDHTPGSLVPLGAVAMGACVIEKHFTDDKTRKGPDHPFAMDGRDFKEMVKNIRIMEKALGSPTKTLYDEERETVMLQRRCLCAARDIPKGSALSEEMIDVLRPFVAGALEPEYRSRILGHIAKVAYKKGDPFTWDNL